MTAILCRVDDISCDGAVARRSGDNFALRSGLASSAGTAERSEGRKVICNQTPQRSKGVQAAVFALIIDAARSMWMSVMQCTSSSLLVIEVRKLTWHAITRTPHATGKFVFPCRIAILFRIRINSLLHYSLFL